MENIFIFLAGALSSMILIILIGIADVYIFKCPKFESDNKLKVYMIASAWELSFIIGGLIVGLIIGAKFP